MIIFAVQTNVVLNKKPDWLDSFIDKYDPKHEHHITLKQVCVISENEILVVKDKFFKYFEGQSLKPIHVTFNKLILEPTNLAEAKGCIMIQAEDNGEINKLQKNILNVLSEHKSYHWPETKEYEENFRPHLTIAANLDTEKYNPALRDLGEDCFVEGNVTKIMLTVVRDFDPKEETRGQREDFEYILNC